jgi:hypothetical protein
MERVHFKLLGQNLQTGDGMNAVPTGCICRDAIYGVRLTLNHRSPTI